MSKFPEVEAQLDVIRRGAVDLIRIEELRAKIVKSNQTGKPLRVKLGIDPTSPDVHLGHSVVIRKLRDFQDLGHLPVLILGDGTALVGDPTGRDTTRPPLTREKIDENVEGYLSQIGKILDLDRAEIVRNGKWFHEMQFSDVLKLLARGTVARMLERDNFTDRMKAGKAIHVHELIYPLMQGWDSVMVHADVELGGTDQLFNLMQGRQMQEEEGQAPQVILTTPILEGLDGRKMSKSYGNHIGLQFEPKEIFGKTMSIPDAQLRSWFTLVTRIPKSQIEELLKEGKNPRDAKIVLAKILIEELHTKETADHEAAAFEKQFSKREVPDDIPEIHLTLSPSDAGVDATNPAFKAELANWSAGKVGFNNFPAFVARLSGESNSNARQLMSQKAVDVDGELATDPKATIWLKNGSVLRVGKRKYFKIKF
ncbi:MAG: tyrosine--tRNA ligase [Planctomycetota bacterium]